MFDIRDEVKVTPTFKFYKDWHDDDLTIVGVRLRKDDIMTYDIRGDDGYTWTGLEESDLKLR